MTTTAALDTHPTLTIAGSRDGKALVSPPRRRAGSRRLISPLILVLAWQAAATLGLISPRTLAFPVQILTTFWGLLASGELVWHLAVSLGRVAAGLAIGLSIGTALALLSGLSRLGEDLVDAPVQMLRTLPFLALVRSPGLLLLDEPFAALDALTRIRMHALVLDLWSRHRPATLLVTHDVDEAVALADRVLVLARGRIVLDLRNVAPRPRERRAAAFAELRERLLQALGVHEQPPHHLGAVA